MPYSTPPTFTVGKIPTKSELDTLGTDIAYLAGPPYCDLYLTAAQNVASGTSYLSITFDTEAADTDTMHSTSVNTSRITATTAGLYLVMGTAAIAANATGYRGLRIAKNGTTDVTRDQSPTTSAASAHWLNVVGFVRLSAGDYVELQALQNSGSALALSTGVGATTFQARWVSL